MDGEVNSGQIAVTLHGRPDGTSYAPGLAGRLC